MASESEYNGLSPEETRQRLVEGGRLQRLTTLLLRKLSLEEVFEIVQVEARELTGAEGGSVFLLEEESWLREIPPDAALDPLSQRIPVEGTLTGQALRKRKPTLVNKYDGSILEARTPNAKNESLLAVPLLIDGVPIGAINVANKQGGFTQDDVRILGLLADVAAIAIENTRLRERAEQEAIVEQRRWLARELHDSVTQAMYSVSLYAEATRMAHAKGKHDVVTENLEELQTMVHEALFGIRVLLFELHPPILGDQGLAESLRIRLAAVESRVGLQTELLVEGERRLPSAMEEELYRIVQEALNNVVKHARAGNVTISLHFDEYGVILEIADNGKGFDPEIAKDGGGIGLRGMEERVQRINGTLLIRTEQDKGTVLRVDVPL